MFVEERWMFVFVFIGAIWGMVWALASFTYVTIELLIIVRCIAL